MTDTTDPSSAIKAIHLASKKVQLTTELEDSIEQLNSITRLLDFRSPSPAALQCLTSLLRKSLLPLYRTFPILGICYAVAVLVNIFETKTLPALKDNSGNLVASWEAIQASLLSGVLDFLEACSSNENRTIVANTLYPTLRSVFFFRADSTFQAGPHLMYILCSLLSDTVTYHPANQAELRNQAILGGADIGFILSKSKNILVVEGLLELFLKLLPSKSRKDSAEARVKYIRDVFDPANFGCSAELIKMLETTPPTADWEMVFIKIIDLLGKSDPTFPQSFKIGDFHVQDSKSYKVERLYVDPLGFVANIDEDDQIETLHALYKSIQSLQVAMPSKTKARITILFSPPPAIDETAIATTEKGAAVSFDIEGKEISRFLQSLELRGVKSIGQVGRKLSKAERVLDLNYDPSGKFAVVSTQEKGRDLARLWDISNSQAQAGQALPTSPLMKASETPGFAPPVPSLTLAPITTPVKGSTTITSPPYYDSIFGTTDELTDPSDVEEGVTSGRSSPSRTRHTRSVKKARPAVSDSEDEAPVIRKVKSKRTTIILSDNESDSMKSPPPKAPRKVELVSPTPTRPRPTRSKAISKTSTTSAAAKEKIAPPDKSITGAAKKTVKPESTLSTPKQICPSPSPVKDKPPRKRKSAADQISDGNDLEIESRPPKRLRASSVKDVPAPKAPRRPAYAKRYGRKGRTSSPALPSGLDVNFDELPALSTETFSKVEEKKSRLSAMKGKGGKSVSKVTTEKKLKNTKDAAPGVLSVLPQKKGNKGKTEVKSTEVVSKGLLSEKAAVESKGRPSANANAESQPQRRSARVAKATIINKGGFKIQSTAEPVKQLEDSGTNEKTVRPPKKPQRAPWEDISVVDLEPATTSIIAAEQLAAEGPIIEEVAQVGLEGSLLGKEAIDDPSALHSADTQSEPQPRSSQTAKSSTNSKPALISTTEPNNQPRNKDASEQEVRSQKKPQRTPNQDLETASTSIKADAVEVTVEQPAVQDGIVEDVIHQAVGETAMQEAIAEDEGDVQMLDLTEHIQQAPKEARSPPQKKETARIMIDLTQGSPQLPKVTAGNALRSKLTSQDGPDRRSSTVALPSPPLPASWRISSTKPNRPRVSFAPSASFASLPTFDLSFESEASVPSHNLKKNEVPSPDRKYHHKYRAHKKLFEDEYVQPTKRRDLDPMPKIIGILDEINKVMKLKTSYRFDKVGKDLRAGERAILLETAQHLEAMLAESVQHHNNFVALETQYARHHRKIIDSLKDAFEIEQKLTTFLAGTIQDHNRNSLSRKFPNTFFSPPLPSIILKPTLKL
ncbi:hypothetical protein DXG01_013343 [Tephrocybe rancida]|nr:hypothetical protein DXG01_013343 [Tephrocybe rancida]